MYSPFPSSSTHSGPPLSPATMRKYVILLYLVKEYLSKAKSHLFTLTCILPSNYQIFFIFPCVFAEQKLQLPSSIMWTIISKVSVSYVLLLCINFIFTVFCSKPKTWGLVLRVLSILVFGIWICLIWKKKLIVLFMLLSIKSTVPNLHCSVFFWI